MGKYVSESLIKDEKVIYEAEIHPIIWVGEIIVALILGALTFGVGLLILVWDYFAIKNMEMAITNKRIIVKHGVLGKHTFEQNLNKIESVQVSQGLFGRMFGMGSVSVIGTGGTTESLGFVKDPFTFRKQFVDITA